MPKALTQAEFIERAIAAHGAGCYDYSQALYKSTKTKVDIRCPVHSIFSQFPGDHMRGIGCPSCGTARAIIAITKPQQLFIDRAQAIHGLKYNYSKTFYTSRANKVSISCKEHGDFEQVAGNHLQGQGCPECGLLKAHISTRSNTESFIEKAQLRHGYRYDYSSTVYTLTKQPVSIICPEHGAFSQVPGNHLRGATCPYCANDRRRKDWLSSALGKRCTLYLLRFSNENESFFKIGVTFIGVDRRYSGKAASAGYQYEILARHISDNAASVYDWEQYIINTFAHLRYKPQSKSFAGRTECFSSCDEILAVFPL